jgi:hypothetical protein
MPNEIVGVDFDNTILTYDEVLSRIARERGLLGGEAARTKREIRDHIRRLPGGEIEWQKCQALSYGPRIGEARLIEGVPEFFRRCREEGVKVYVVSHKTENSRYDTTGTNLREAALGWMVANGFFEAEGLGLRRDQVFFAATRAEKIERVKQLGCTHFIDDLEETFLEERFPAGTVRLLYEPAGESTPPPEVTRMKSWRQIGEYFFGAN